MLVTTTSGRDLYDFDLQCDDLFVGPIDLAGDGGWTAGEGYWEEKKRKHAKQPHFWMMPSTRSLYSIATGAWEKRSITVASCKTKEFTTCRLKQVNILETYTVGNIEELIQRIKTISLRARTERCMPWAPGGRMTHLLTQFNMFAGLQTYDREERVTKCSLNKYKIGFLSTACWTDDSAMVFLKPNYKFNLKSSGNKEICTIGNNLDAQNLVVNDGIDLTFLETSITFELDDTSVYPLQWTECKYTGRDPAQEKLKFVSPLVWILIPETIRSKKIQFYNYQFDVKQTTCTDYVSVPCVDNAMSLYGKACMWVAESKKSGGLLLSDLFTGWPASFTNDFMLYGAGEFVMDLTGKNIRMLRQYYTANGQKYTAEATDTVHALSLDSRLFFVETNMFSCTGCTGFLQVPDPAAKFNCDVPQACIECSVMQRVVSSPNSIVCDSPFAMRKCQDCEKHETRSSETTCAECPPLEPMRRSGNCRVTYCGDSKCTECSHTQYFDKTSAEGCLYFMSVADGVTFTDGVRFNREYVDQYKPPGSTRAPEAIPALHYRNLMSAGSSWDKSSIASKCEPSIFSDFNYPGILTRNVWGQRIRYRRWCGHEEMLKDNNAELQLLACYPVGFFSDEYSVLPVYPNIISLRDAKDMRNTVIIKERVRWKNRVAEIKLVNISRNVECHFEIRREGRTDDCTYCNGTFYTKDCGPTYHASFGTPASTGPGTCEKCEPQCAFPDNYFNAIEFSCWSNGTSRVSSNVSYGSVRSIGEAMSTTRNYWYKPAACVACAKLRTLTAASVPQIVTRCGNKVTFEVWHPTLTIIVLQEKRPRRRVCCAIDSIAVLDTTNMNSDIGVRCVIETESATLEVASLTVGGTPLCQTVVPDLSTTSVPFCPPGWFFNSANCPGTLTAWSQQCCSLCSGCATAGALKTNQWKLCSGDTAEDTQAAGCVASCADKNYQVGNDSCVECESCG